MVFESLSCLQIRDHRMQRRRCCPTGNIDEVHSQYRWARLLQREPHRWLQHVDDSGREWLVRNVRVDGLHGGSELGLSDGAEGWRRQGVQECVRGIWEPGVQLQ
ncbi:hypothetical protein CK203_080334 [Vitis vinifera]|uniref:Uncharacterized protein n=1 Tax=Vitis vinifera TaxID=29760 RepID=A0A438CNK0_VITVI|nr:hypothetical protein CK203_080334 [Vitis vinifera]